MGDPSSQVACLGTIDIFFNSPARSTKATDAQDSGSSGAEIPGLKFRGPGPKKTVDPPGWSGSQEISPHQAAAPGSGEILNRDSEPGSGQQLHPVGPPPPPSLGSILKSDRAVHNPETSPGMPSESPQHARRRPHDIRSQRDHTHPRWNRP